MKALTPGRAFEQEILGITDLGNEAGFYTYPKLIELEHALRYVINHNWVTYADSLAKGHDFCHNPMSPKVGKTREIWEAVKDFLPGKVGEYTKVKVPLNLYIAIGMNSLDYRLGVDAFFWWQGVYATIDVTTSKGKHLRGFGADFLFTRKEVEPVRLREFGKEVAALLIKRRELLSKQSD